jgi:hypothetical protein
MAEVEAVGTAQAPVALNIDAIANWHGPPGSNGDGIGPIASLESEPTLPAEQSLSLAGQHIGLKPAPQSGLPRRPPPQRQRFRQ